ncbi:unnamed protein product [Euphydryas editha]|uniref:115 kDa protein in type-1 retrotransposable element R1DM n=1 Tax=Euphydryas editha TaxID=104508 RepID=A0AAU9V0P3_EUPED|nr:unnamed protein product [Euphydryas editha]
MNFYNVRRTDKTAGTDYRPEAHFANVSATCKKAADMYKQLACAAKVTWGLNGEIVRTIYMVVIEAFVLYAATAWSPAAEKLSIRKQLDSLQRGFAQKICKA